jgi:hypothetical protein
VVETEKQIRASLRGAVRSKYISSAIVLRGARVHLRPLRGARVHLRFFRGARVHIHSIKMLRLASKKSGLRARMGSYPFAFEV